jgi:hypothetical protein
MTMLSARAALLAFGCTFFIATASAAATKPPATTGAQVGSGTLEAAQREYTPQSCTHNGNTAVCTFAVVNRGNPLTLHAWPGDLRTLQLVDASHVPHSPNRAYFVDASGTHQTQLLLRQSDQGSIIVEFPNVDSNSSASEFHLHSQIVAGVGFGGTPATTPAAQNATTSAAGSTASSAPASKATAASAATSTPTIQPQTGIAGTPSPAAVSTETSCAANPKSAACRAALQEDQVCAKKPDSAACKNATARAQKVEATVH